MLGVRERGRRTFALAVALLLVLPLLIGLQPADAAQPPGVVPNSGPIDLATGYPMWYEDQNNLRLAMCVDDGTHCLGVLEDPTALPSVPDNWILNDAGLPGGEAEGFWWDATARIDYPAQPGSSDGGRATLVLAKEATWAFGEVAVGEQIAFGRLRIRLRGLQPNATYTITHPYGVDVETADGRGRMEHQVSDIGCFDVPCDFTSALDSRPMPYLRWDNTAPAPPAGYASQLGVPHTVTGSPTGNNFFRVEGPGIGTVETDLFDVQAKLWQTPATARLAFDSAFNVVNFGEQTDEVPLTATATLTNVGAEPLVIGDFDDAALTGPAADDFTVVGTTCDAAVPSDGACTIDFSFSGSAAGLREAALVLASNDPYGTLELPLRAEAIDLDAPRPVQGPIDPETGFPLWYEDQEGTRLDLCLDEGAVAGGDCLAVLPFPDQPVNVPGNFDPETEAFYWHAEADMSDRLPLPPGEEPELERAQLVLGLEAAFANEELIQGDQIVFGRVRVRVDDLVAGATYTVTHPFGVDEIVADDIEEGPRPDGLGDIGEINVTEDLGCLELPCDFTRPFTARTWPFLTAVDPAPPAGLVGDPNQLATVIGSPADNNVFRLEGAGLPEGGIETTFFSVQGREWARSASPDLAIDGRFNQVAFGRQVLPVVDLTRPLTLTNAGSGTLEISDLQVVTEDGQPSSDFTVTGDCPALAPDQPCALTVGFTPTSPGAKVAYLETTSNDDNMPTHRIRLSGNALEVTVPVPTQPSDPQLHPGSDSGLAGDNLTNDNTPTFIGTATSGTTVELLARLAGDAAAEFNVVASGTAVGGQYTLTSSVLTDGQWEFAARSGELTSGSTFVTIDTVAPDAPSTPERATPDGFTFTGTAEANSTVELLDNGTVAGSSPAAGDGSWSITIDPLAAGTHSITARATDAAANTGPESDALAVVVEGPPNEAPSIPILSAPADEAAVTTATPTLSWEASTDPDNDPISYEVQVAPDCTFATTTINESGIQELTFTTPTALADGMYCWRVRATDGTTPSEYSATRTFTVQVPTGDITGPEIGAIDVGVRVNAQIGTRDVPIGVEWTSTDPSGVASQVLELSTDRGRRWAPVATLGGDVNSHDVQLRPGNTGYGLRVRATDTAGNETTSNPTLFTLGIIEANKREVALTGAWSRSRIANAYSNQAQVTTTDDSTATLTVPGTGEAQVAWVATSPGSPTGSAVVTAGSQDTTVSLDSARAREIVFVSERVAAGSSLRLVTTGRVDIDVFVVLQYQ